MQVSGYTVEQIAVARYELLENLGSYPERFRDIPQLWDSLGSTRLISVNDLIKEITTETPQGLEFIQLYIRAQKTIEQHKVKTKWGWFRKIFG